MSQFAWRQQANSSIRKAFRTLADDVGGFAAVEFAMVVPIMVMLLLGCVEVSDAMCVNKRAGVVASSISDLVSRSATMTKTDAADIFKIGHILIGKYPTQNLYSEVVSMEPVNGVMKVTWSVNSNGGSPYAVGSTYPGSWDGMVDAANSLIVSKTTYTYTSPIGQYLHGPIVLSQVSSNVSRIGAVKCPTC